MQAPVGHQNAPETLDIRGIPAPDNVLSVLSRASQLPQGASLEIHAECNPWQLYDLLQQRGYTLRMTREKDGTYKGLVTPRDLAALKQRASN